MVRRGWDGAAQVVCAGSMDTYHIYVWQLKTSRLLDEVGGHEGPVISLAFSPTQPLLASASWDQTVRTWDIFRYAFVRTYYIYFCTRGTHGVPASAPGTFSSAHPLEHLTYIFAHIAHMGYMRPPLGHLQEHFIIQRPLKRAFRHRRSFILSFPPWRVSFRVLDKLGRAWPVACVDAFSVLVSPYRCMYALDACEGLLLQYVCNAREDTSMHGALPRYRCCAWRW